MIRDFRSAESAIEESTLSAPSTDLSLSSFSCVVHPPEQGFVLVSIAGELDVASSGHARDALRRAQGESACVRCDLSALSFLDMSGLHVLVDAATDARRAGGDLAIAACSPAVRRLLALLELDDRLRPGLGEQREPPQSVARAPRRRRQLVRPIRAREVLNP